MTEKLRAPFVWTPRQAIDEAGFRKHYLGADARPNEKNRWFLFRKTVRLAAAPTSAPFSITVDGRYILYVNGAELGRGPVRCSPLFQRYDDYDLAAALGAGDNVIAVLVHTYGRDTAFYETTKGMWQPTFGDGGLWTEGAAETPAGAVSLSTHEGWRCIQSDAWVQAGDWMHLQPPRVDRSTVPAAVSAAPSTHRPPSPNVGCHMPLVVS